jgi:hypothetical protein
MRAFKFLGQGAIGTFTGFVWPAPGAWVDVTGPLDPCRNGFHVCHAHELAHWLHEELWELDVDGDQLAGTDCFVVRRARLVRQVAAWDAAGTVRFAHACIEHADQSGAAGDALAEARGAADGGYPAIAAYIAALAVGRIGPAAELEQGYARERTWQSDWIAREML